MFAAGGVRHARLFRAGLPAFPLLRVAYSLLFLIGNIVITVVFILHQPIPTERNRSYDIVI